MKKLDAATEGRKIVLYIQVRPCRQAPEFDAATSEIRKGGTHCKPWMVEALERVSMRQGGALRQL